MPDPLERLELALREQDRLREHLFLYWWGFWLLLAGIILRWATY